MHKPADKSYKKNVTEISKDKLKDFLPFILAEVVPDVIAGRAVCLGITSDEGKPVGAGVIDEEDIIEEEDEIYYRVESLYVVPEYRRQGYFKKLFAAFHERLWDNGANGFYVQLTAPFDDGMEKALKAVGFTRGGDGNTIFEVEAGSVIRYFDEKISKAGNSEKIRSFASLSPGERDSFTGKAGKDYPEGLSPVYLPGEMMRRLSYVIEEGDTVKSLLLTSLMGADMLYIGALYAKNKTDGIQLLKQMIDDVKGEPAIRRFMFAAATEDALKLAEHIIGGSQAAVKVSRVHNFYYVY